jgi:hypothetical protein
MAEILLASMDTNCRSVTGLHYVKESKLLLSREDRSWRRDRRVINEVTLGLEWPDAKIGS